MSGSTTQRSDAGEARTRGPSVSSALPLCHNYLFEPKHRKQNIAFEFHEYKDGLCAVCKQLIVCKQFIQKF